MSGFLDTIPLSLYIHLPWCRHKCPYCDFNSHAIATLSTSMEQDYLRAISLDLEQESKNIRGRIIQTIFIGGGTPSLFSADGIANLMETINQHLTIADDAEVTLEANPGSSEYPKFERLLHAGINRLSLGVQSFDDNALHSLGRIHNAQEARTAFAAAREAGFDNINIDLMFGLPGQEQAQGEADVCAALALHPEHISYYQLTIEPNTRFYSHRPDLPAEQTTMALEAAALALLADAGYRRYEVSAYARLERRSRHNLNYWCYGDYLGIGAGAHSKLSSDNGVVIRFAKSRRPDLYIRDASSGNQVRVAEHTVNAQEKTFEFMLNVSRLTEGFTPSLFRHRTGLDFACLRARIDQLKQRDLLEEAAQVIKPTVRGLQFLNDVQMSFLPDSSCV